MEYSIAAKMKNLLFIVCLLCAIRLGLGFGQNLQNGYDSTNPRCSFSGRRSFGLSQCRKRHWEPRWAYDNTNGKCIFAGWVCTCDVDGSNMFRSEKDCRMTCECTLPPKTGMCRALIPRYYYNPSTRMCQDFFYGGCQANANNFETMEDCVKTCDATGGLIVAINKPNIR